MTDEPHQVVPASTTAMGLAIVSSVIAILGLVLTGYVKPPDTQASGVVLGILSAALLIIVCFYFGSSWGSRSKDITHVKPVPPSPPVPPRPVPPTPPVPPVPPKPEPIPVPIGKLIRGPVSYFGGPEDTGVSPSEGLALCESGEAGKFPGFFLSAQPAGTTGLARRLDPSKFYIACRWWDAPLGFDRYSARDRAYLQSILIPVTNPANGKTGQARAIDCGPNANTGRVADLSPGLMDYLGLKTDQTAEVVIPLQGQVVPPAPVPSGATPWLDAMVQITGTHEVDGAGDNATILGWAAFIGKKYPEMAEYAAGYVHDEIPWCGLTVAYCMAKAGIRPQFGPSDTDKFLWADAWRQFGTAVSTPQPGDVLVFQWANGGHHVTLYDHETDGDQYACRGGNQGDMVNVTLFPMSACIAIRRPA